MQPYTRTLTASKHAPTWAASTKKTIEVPLDRYLSAILLRFSFTYDTAASPTVNEDGVLNGVSRINLKVNGKVVRSYAPKRAFYRHILDLGVSPERVNATTTVANGKTATFVLPIYFRLNPRDEFDVRALLAAPHLSSVEIEVEWGAANAFGTNQTIQSGSVTPTFKELVLTPGEEGQFYGRSGQDVVRAGSRLLELIETEQGPKTNDQAYSNYGFTFDLPTGAHLARSHVFATDNALRSDALVTELRVKDSAGNGWVPIEESWSASQARDLMEYGPPAAIDGNLFLKGYTVLDYRDFGGLRLATRRTGEVQAQFTTIAPTGTSNVVLLHEAVAPIDYSRSAA